MSKIVVVYICEDCSTSTESIELKYNCLVWYSVNYVLKICLILFNFLPSLPNLTPSETLQRYKSILKTLPKAKTTTRAFHKHAIDRYAVVSTSPIGELVIMICLPRHIKSYSPMGPVERKYWPLISGVRQQFKDM